MGQDGQTAEPGRMVSLDGRLGWARMGRWQSREGWLARTGGLGWTRMGGQGLRGEWLARTGGQDGSGWADGRAGKDG